MRSKTFFFNGTVFKKNLTRFAPVWGLYTLCLGLMVFLNYNDSGKSAAYTFANNYANLVEALVLLNMGYALLTAQLLFGDLFNSRMCNAIHALPVRREGLFLTNVLSGLTVSLAPTAIMTVLGLALLRGSVFTNAAQMAGMVFLAANLQFVCFFGMAVFCVMCTGNRFAMAAGYGLLNFGACIGFFLADTLYTPMLYGVVTPTALMKKLTPANQLWETKCVTPVGKYRGVLDDMGNLIPGATDRFAFVGDDLLKLAIWAGVGLAFALIALALYRRRDLERAGDAVAFPCLTPVFQVFCAIVVSAAVFSLMENIRDLSGSSSYLVLAVGLAVGWFVGKMLTYRSTRVFQLKNWVQLGILTAVIAASLVATKLDVLGIETRQPDLEEIESVLFSTNYTSKTEYTDPADIQAVLDLHRLAVEDQVEQGGTYLMENGEPVPIGYRGGQESRTDIFYATNISLEYTLKNGKTIRRRYAVWSDQEEGDIARHLLSRWELHNRIRLDTSGREIDPLVKALDNFQSLTVAGAEDQFYYNSQDISGLIAALQADCAAGQLAGDPYLHNGFFQVPDAKLDSGYYQRKDLYLFIDGGDEHWSIDVYPECVNTLRWLDQRGLLTMEIMDANIVY